MGGVAQPCAECSGFETGTLPTAANLRKAWATLFALGKHGDGRAGAARAMRLCGADNALKDEDDVMALALWAESAWDYMAMVSDIENLCSDPHCACSC